MQRLNVLIDQKIVRWKNGICSTCEDFVGLLYGRERTRLPSPFAVSMSD